MTEIGSHPGCNGSGDTAFKCNGSNTVFSRSDWFTFMDQYLVQDAEANEYLLGFAYFHENQTHDWRFIDTTAGGDVDNRGLATYKSNIAKTLFRSSGAGFNVAFRSPIPDAQLGGYTTAGNCVFCYSGVQNVRDHAGSSLWTPRRVDFNSGWDSTNNRSWMVFGFEWYQPEHKLEVGEGITIEINAEVDCTWARSYYTMYRPDHPTWSPGREGYDHRGFETNIPTYTKALPYEDTTVLEPCMKSVDQYGGTGRGWFGAGVLNAQTLPTGHYYIKVAMDNLYGAAYRGFDSSVKLRVKAGAVYNSGSKFADQDNQDCNFDQSEIDHWNDQNNDAGWKRQQAGYCAWTDWEQAVHTGSISTSVNYSSGWFLDYLYNQGGGDGGVSDNGYSYLSGNNHVVYCNNPFVGHFDGVCAIEINKGSAAYGTIWQDVSANTGPGYVPTTETAVRCRNGSSCLFDFGVWGRGITADEAMFNNNLQIPDDGHWYICRTDFNHNTSGFPGYFTGFHDTLRWQLYNYSGGSMDVDYTYLNPGTTYWKDADNGFKLFDSDPFTHYWGVGHANVGSACTQK